MSTFSERLGYKIEKPIQFESVSDTLRNRIWNLFYLSDIQKGGLGGKRVNKALTGKPAIEDLILDKLGLILTLSTEVSLENKKLTMLQNHLLKCPWNEVYEFVEAHISSVDDEDREQRIQDYNVLFESEKSGYRFVNGELIPITNNEELAAIEEAGNTPFDSVDKHIKKASSLYSDISTPDYENSIKESICAVEAMCCIITENEKATLGEALKQLENKGIKLHKAFESSMRSLYGYTSDEGGIRHGSIDFTGASSEDAKYMLITCSAFVNYLIEKWEKVKNV